MIKKKIRDQRVILPWLGAGLVMVALIIMWARSLPDRLQIMTRESAESQNIFKNKLTEFKNVWRSSNERVEDLKNLAAALTALKEAQASSTTTVKLTAPQIKSLKQKLNTAK